MMIDKTEKWLSQILRQLKKVVNSIQSNEIKKYSERFNNIFN